MNLAIYRFTLGLAWVVVVGIAADNISATSDADFSAELPRVPPVEPRDALGTFEVEPGFRIELVAAEPLVSDPVAVSFDELGRLYVVEMCDYSEQDHDFLGVIHLLEDTDADGRFDRSTPFAEKLSWPTAVICYDGGVFVGAAPDIWFLKDHDGDGRADERRRVFTGFGRDNVQGLLNSFNWGLDGRIHGATSSSGGEVRRTDAGKNGKSLSLRGRDFAFDPRTLDMTPESGGAQHGLSFDDWGRKFVCHNSDHIQLVMFEDRYIARNPYLAAPSPRLSIAADGPQAEVYRISPVEPWRIVRTRLRVAGAVPGPVEGGGRPAGYFTSATGVTIYRGNVFPPPYQGNAFIGDVGSNIIHRKVLESDGLALVAHRATADRREFIASRDIWFRPAQFANAPDGALYIADVYREVIEHPQSLPPVIKKHLDLTSGRDRGRIYRVVPKDFRQPKLPRLDRASLAELVAALENSNGWHRDTAARLLMQKRDSAAVPALKDLVDKSPSRLARVHALYVLRNLDALDSKTLRAGMDDDHPGVRVHAVRLAEEMTSADQQIRAKLQEMANDEDEHVRYQLAFSLGELPVADRIGSLTSLAKRDADNRWMRLAIQSSLRDGAGQVVEALLADEKARCSHDHRELIEALLAQIGSQRNENDIQAVLRSIEAIFETDPRLATDYLIAVADGLSAEALHRFVAENHFENLAKRIDTIVGQALIHALDESVPAAGRAAAIGALRLSRSQDYGASLIPLLVPQQPQEVQLAAVKALGAVRDKSIVEPLLGSWPNLAPSLKSSVLEILFARADRLPDIVDALERQRLAPVDIDRARIKMLTGHADPGIRARAERLFGQRPSSARAGILETYQPVLKLSGKPAAGKQVFQKNCAGCHRLEGVGMELAPNLATIQNRGAESILTNVLDPNREVNPQYLNYVLITTDGRSVTGMISSETATSVTLVRGENQRDTILRSNIETLESTATSLMPEGLEREITLQAMADLIAYLMSVR